MNPTYFIAATTLISYLNYRLPHFILKKPLALSIAERGSRRAISSQPTKKFTRISQKNQKIPAPTPKIHKTPIHTSSLMLKNRQIVVTFLKKALKSLKK